MLPDALATACLAAARRSGVPLREPLLMVALGGRAHGRRTSVFVMESGRAEATLFLKTVLTSEASGLRAEAAGLASLADRTPLARSVPRPIGLVEVADRTVLIQRALAGRPIHSIIRGIRRPRREVEHDLPAAARWLVTFQRATRGEVVPLGGVQEVERHAASLLRAEVTDAAVHAGLEVLAADAARYADLAVPAGAVHGDLWPGNLLRSGDDLGVVDWEHYEALGDPMWDLWFLLFTFAHTIPGRRRSWVSASSAFHRAFCADGWYRRLADGAIGEHLRHLGVPAGAGPLSLYLTLLRQQERQGAVARVGPVDVEWPDLATRWLRGVGSGAIAPR